MNVVVASGLLITIITFLITEVDSLVKNFALIGQKKQRISRPSLMMGSQSSPDNIDETSGLRIRTVTVFINLIPADFQSASTLEPKIQACSSFLKTAASAFQDAGYEVQTLRIATNPFGEYICNSDASDDQPEIRIHLFQSLLSKYDISFCSVGPAISPQQITKYCPILVSNRFSCSALIPASDVASASATAKTIMTIANLGEQLQGSPDFLKGGLGNFQFCAAAASCKPFIPFFPAAKSASGPPGIQGFALGLENGGLALRLLTETKSIANIATTFREGMAKSLLPLRNIAEKTVALNTGVSFLGIDTSLNPSLDEGGSVAAAIESLEEITQDFGGPGSLAAAAAITTALQSLPGIQHCGYSGLMLPVCEDRRLAELSDKLLISNLLCISSVCGVGVDTVPIAGNADVASLTSLLLDVAGLAERWDKSLSCRVFPVPGSDAGELTTFDSPYLCNSKIFDLL